MRRFSGTLAPLVLALGFMPQAATAQRLPDGVTPSHYDLNFDVDLANARFAGTETIRVDVARPTRTIVVNAAEITFREVTIESGPARQTAAVAVNKARQTATFTVPRPLAAGAAQIHVTYSGILNDKLRGFYLSTENGRRFAVTQFEATDARRAFPGFDEPAFKATFNIALTIDAGDSAVSNGTVVSDTPAAKSGTASMSSLPYGYLMSKYVL